MSDNNFKNHPVFRVYSTDTPVSIEYPFFIEQSKNISKEQRLQIQKVHSHEFFQILYILAGSIEHFTEQGPKQKLSKGELILLPPFVKHSDIYPENSNVLTLSFLPSFIDSSFKSHFDIDGSQHFLAPLFHPFLDMIKNPDLIKKFSLSVPDSTQIHHHFIQILSFFQNSSIYNRVAVHSSFTQALSLISEFYQNQFNLPKEKNTETSLHKYYPNVYQAIQYLQDHSNLELDFDQLIASTKISPTYFRKIFKDITGKSCYQYLTELRVYRSVQLMKESKEQLQHIAKQVGFHEFLNFQRSFKRILGQSPSHFRKSSLRG